MVSRIFLESFIAPHDLVGPEDRSDLHKKMEIFSNRSVYDIRVAPAPTKSYEDMKLYRKVPSM
jgi:hypothetical protein